MRFSIITVVKDAYPQIENTVKSVLNQNFKNYEYIILDSQSNDGTSELIKKIKNRKVRYERKKDKGLYFALNKATLKAKGQYIINLHAGDLFYSNSTLKKLNSKIKKQISYDFFFSNIAFFKKNKVVRLWRMPQKKINKFSFLKIPHTSLCIKNKVARKLSYDTKYKISSDINYLKDICKNYKGKYLDFYNTFMELGGLSTSMNLFGLKLKEDLSILKKEFKWLFTFILFYKLLIKLPGLLKNKKKFTMKLVRLKKINNFY